MNQYIETNKLAIYLHSISTDPFLELKPEPIKSPSSNTSTLVQQNFNLIDLCAFNSLYPRPVETSPSSSDTSSHKPFVTSSDLCIQIPQVSPPGYSNQSNGMFVSSSNSTENNFDLPTSIKTSSDPITIQVSATNDNNSNTSTSLSNSKVKHIVQQSSPTNSSISQELSKVISYKRHDLSTSHDNESDATLDYKLSSKIKISKEI
jgi:hypothetical protein